MVIRFLPLSLKRKYSYTQLYRWKIDTQGKYAVALIGTFILAIGIEGLNFLRYHLQAQAYTKINA